MDNKQARNQERERERERVQLASLTQQNPAWQPALLCRVQLSTIRTSSPLSVTKEVVKTCGAVDTGIEGVVDADDKGTAVDTVVDFNDDPDTGVAVDFDTAVAVDPAVDLVTTGANVAPDKIVLVDPDATGAVDPDKAASVDLDVSGVDDPDKNVDVGPNNTGTTVPTKRPAQPYIYNDQICKMVIESSNSIISTVSR